MQCSLQPAATYQTFNMAASTILDLTIHPQHLSVLPTVVFHPCCQRDIQTMAAVFYLTLSGRSARSFLFQANSASYPQWDGE